MKMLRNLSEKLRAKLPSTTHGYSMVKFAPLNDAFSEFLQLEPSPVEGQSLQQKDKRRRKRKGTQKKNEKEEEEEGHFLIQKSQTFNFRAKMLSNMVLVKKKAMLPCCKCLLE